MKSKQTPSEMVVFLLETGFSYRQIGDYIDMHFTAIFRLKQNEDRVIRNKKSAGRLEDMFQKSKKLNRIRMNIRKICKEQGLPVPAGLPEP